MADTTYTKQYNADFVIAKRGFCYFLYISAELAQADDRLVATNIDRLNQGRPAFNRCLHGHWAAYSRKLSHLKQFIADLYNNPDDLHDALCGWSFGCID